MENQTTFREKKSEFIELIKKEYNEIFDAPNKKNVSHSSWYHNYYGSYGMQEVSFENNHFYITIIVHCKAKKLVISFNDMLERVYLFDRFVLEGYYTLSINADKVHNDMKISNSTDGYFLVLNTENIAILNDKINKDFQRDFEYSMEFYNSQVVHNATLPEKPEYDFKDCSFEDIMTLLQEDDSSKYKRDTYKPELQQIDLNDYLVLETFT
jgi:hypothetical protein